MKDNASAEALFINLERACRSPKAARSLANIKAAVDLLLKSTREQTLSSVAAICVDRFGGPKYQTICNNRDYRAYINARFAEARSEAIGNLSKAPPPIEAQALIDTLKAQVQTLSEENARLQKAFRTLSPVPASVLTGQLTPTSALDATRADNSRDTSELASAERRDLRHFLKSLYDYGFDIDENGRLVTARGLTVIGKDGIAALRRLVGAAEQTK